MKKEEFVEIFEDISDMREELDDHLVAINENTEEIEANYSYLMAFGKRLEGVEEKIDYIYNVLKSADLIEHKQKKAIPQKITLTKNEQKVFAVLYERGASVDYKELEKETKRSRVSIRNSINSMIEKGVPISKTNYKKQQYFALDPGFRELQAKENVLNMDKALTLDCFDQSVVHN